MTSLVHHHASRLRLGAAPRSPRAVEPRRSAGRREAATVTVAAVACLVAGLVWLVVVYADIETGGRVPHPVPLPAPTGQSLAGN